MKKEGIDDAWIGLYKSDSNVPSEECDVECERLEWTWLDGSSYNLTVLNKWFSFDPDAGSGCVRMHDGKWRDKNCDAKYPYICVRGRIYV